MSIVTTGVLGVVGQVAGIGGLALGVLLLVLRDIIRKNIFPKFKDERLAFRLLRLIVVTVWTVAILGIVAWAIAPRPSPVTNNNTVIDKMVIDLGRTDLTPVQRAKLDQAVALIKAKEYEKARPLIDELVREAHPEMKPVLTLIPDAADNAARDVNDAFENARRLRSQPTTNAAPGDRPRGTPTPLR